MQFRVSETCVLKFSEFILDIAFAVAWLPGLGDENYEMCVLL